MKYPDTSSLGFKIIKHRKSQCDICNSRTTSLAVSYEKKDGHKISEISVPICEQDLPKTINALARKRKNDQRLEETIKKTLNKGKANKGKARSIDSLVCDIADANDSEDSGDECRSDEFSEEEPPKTNNRSRKRLRPARIIDDEEEPQPKRHKITKPQESTEEPYDDDFTGLVEGKDDSDSSDESLPSPPSPPTTVVSPIAPSTVSTPRSSELNQLLESLGVSGV